MKSDLHVCVFSVSVSGGGGGGGVCVCVCVCMCIPYHVTTKLHHCNKDASIRRCQYVCSACIANTPANNMHADISSLQAR